MKLSADLLRLQYQAKAGTVCLLSLILVFTVLSPCLAVASNTGSGVLVVLANRLTVYDIIGQPEMNSFLKEAAVGLVSPSSSGFRNPAAVHASVAAGAYSRGSNESRFIYNADEEVEGATAAEVYARRTGYSVPDSGIVHIGLAGMVAANRRLADPPIIWSLGHTLQESEIPRAVFGNADTDKIVWRAGAALLIDSQGRINRGDVGSETTRRDPMIPGGVGTDLDGILSDALHNLADGAVVLVDYGDLERIERERNSCTAEAYQKARNDAVNRLADWLLQMQEAVPDTPIVLLSLVPPYSEAGRWDTLGFAAVKHTGFRHGLLISNTTRTPGLIAAIDITPTILSIAGAEENPDMQGFLASSLSSVHPTNVLVRWDQTVSMNNDLQKPVVFSLGLMGFAAMVISTGYLVGRKKRKVWSLVAVIGMTLTAWVPVMLLIPMDRPEWYGAVPFALLASFLVAAMLKDRPRFFPLEVATCVLLLLLLLSASGALDLVKRSVLNAWQLQGLRYYGIGNEFLGCLIGGAAVIPLWRFGRSDTKVPVLPVSLWFVFWVLVIGLPILGANSGGAIAATVTFGLILKALMGHPIRARDALAFTLAGIAVTVILAIVDAVAWGGSPSHLGQAVKSFGGDPGYLWSIVERKVLMNLSLVGRVETRVSLAFAGMLLLFWLIYRDKLISTVRMPGRIIQGLVGLTYGALAALVFNDSGIVTFAFMASYGIVWCLWDATTKQTGGLPVVRRQHARSGR